MIETVINYVKFNYGRMSSPKTREDIIKTALVYRFLYEHYVRDTLPLETILYRLDKYFHQRPPTSNILRNH